MEEVKYDFAYMFMYSERPGTLAQRKYTDDVPEDVKARRLDEIIALQQENALKRNKLEIGKVHRVLIEGVSKRSEQDFYGRNDQNKVIIFPINGHAPAEYVDVIVDRCTSATLFGQVIED